jgi:hypothetical protein
MGEPEEIVELSQGWSAGTLDSVSDSIAYHHARHGAGMTLLEYLRAADRFPRGHAVPGNVRWDGTYTLKHRDGRFLIVDAVTHKIVSYGRNPV